MMMWLVCLVLMILFMMHGTCELMLLPPFRLSLDPQQFPGLTPTNVTVSILGSTALTTESNVVSFDSMEVIDDGKSKIQLFIIDQDHNAMGRFGISSPNEPIQLTLPWQTLYMIWGGFIVNTTSTAIYTADTLVIKATTGPSVDGIPSFVGYSFGIFKSVALDSSIVLLDDDLRLSGKAVDPRDPSSSWYYVKMDAVSFEYGECGLLLFTFHQWNGTSVVADNTDIFASDKLKELPPPLGFLVNSQTTSILHTHGFYWKDGGAGSAQMEHDNECADAPVTTSNNDNNNNKAQLAYRFKVPLEKGIWDFVGQVGVVSKKDASQAEYLWFKFNLIVEQPQKLRMDSFSSMEIVLIVLSVVIMLVVVTVIMCIIRHKEQFLKKARPLVIRPVFDRALRKSPFKPNAYTHLQDEL